MIVVSFAFLVSSSRRESTTIDVIDGCSMQRLSTAEPTRPVAPVTMTFIFVFARVDTITCGLMTWANALCYQVWKV